MGLKERFLKTYADVPLELRNQIILVLNDKPLSWNVAYIEITKGSKDSEIILKKLDELGII